METFDFDIQKKKIKISMLSGFFRPAVKLLAYRFCLCRAITYPFQNPIKNIICSPE